MWWDGKAGSVSHWEQRGVVWENRLENVDQWGNEMEKYKEKQWEG
jgi:hypothetical protein